MGAKHNDEIVREKRLAALLHVAKSVDADMGWSLMVTLLAVAREPGLSVNELAERIGAPQQTASRYVSILQGRYSSLNPDLKIFEREPLISLEVSKIDPRRKALYLTPDGVMRVDGVLGGIYRDG